ncbi:MAG: YadA C-terminal domain-containing protein [Sedimenticola sp.]
MRIKLLATIISTIFSLNVFATNTENIARNTDNIAKNSENLVQLANENNSQWSTLNNHNYTIQYNHNLTNARVDVNVNAISNNKIAIEGAEVRITDTENLLENTIETNNVRYNSTNSYLVGYGNAIDEHSSKIKDNIDLNTAQSNTINNNVIKISANTKNMNIINHATLRLNDGVNNNLNAININQDNIQNNTNKIDTNRNESASGIAIAMASTINMPRSGKNFNLTVAVAEYQGYKAMSISSAVRVNKQTNLFMSLGATNSGKYTASKFGASFDW